MLGGHLAEQHPRTGEITGVIVILSRRDTPSERIACTLAGCEAASSAAASPNRSTSSVRPDPGSPKGAPPPPSADPVPAARECRAGALHRAHGAGERAIWRPGRRRCPPADRQAPQTTVAPRKPPPAGKDAEAMVPGPADNLLPDRGLPMPGSPSSVRQAGPPGPGASNSAAASSSSRPTTGTTGEKGGPSPTISSLAPWGQASNFTTASKPDAGVSAALQNPAMAMPCMRRRCH